MAIAPLLTRRTHVLGSPVTVRASKLMASPRSAVGWKRDEVIFPYRATLVHGNRSAVNPQDSRPGLAGYGSRIKTNGEPTVSAVGWKRDEVIFQMWTTLVDQNP